MSNKTINEFKKLLPKHAVSLQIIHNDHKDIFLSVSEWDSDNHLYEWVSSAERCMAIELDEVWAIQVYPDTKNGFYSYCASSLEALINYVNEEH